MSQAKTQPICANSDLAPVALVTGGAKRIGAEIVQQLHCSGYNVIAHYNQSSTEAKQLINQLNEMRAHSAVCISADLGQVDQINNLVNKAEAHWGRLDLVVNNASSFFPTPLENVTEDAWHDLMSSNAKGPLFLTKACLSSLRKCQGQVINIVDMHLERPLKGFSIYSMGKSALMAMTKVLAVELAPEIRVNAVAPGAIIWPEHMQDAEGEFDEGYQSDVIQSIPLKRLGTAKDIADTVMFLTKAHYITGQVITVDGGRSLSKSWDDFQ